LILTLSGCAVVSPGERGIPLSFGKVGDITLGEGYYLWIPFVKRIITLPIRVQKTETQTEAATKDMQKVTSTIAVNWHLDPAAVNKVYQTVGDEDDIVRQIIAPAVSEVLKSSTAKMTAEEVLTKRIELKTHIDEDLKLRLKVYNVFVDDISLVDLNFTKEFNHAVEEKQIAEQQAKQAEYIALKATQDAKAAVNTARGQAESNLVVAEAQAKSQKLLMQTLTKDILQMEYLKKWDGQLPNVMSGNSSGMILNLPTQK